MPEYLFRHRTTGKKWKEWMTISERDKFEKNNPDVEQMVYGSPRLVSMTGSKPKIDEGFKSILKSIKKKNPRSTINTY